MPRGILCILGMYDCPPQSSITYQTHTELCEVYSTPNGFLNVLEGLQDPRTWRDWHYLMQRNVTLMLMTSGAIMVCKRMRESSKVSLRCGVVLKVATRVGGGWISV